MNFTDVFGNETIPPAGNGYSAFTTTSAQTRFYWPYNYSGTGQTIAKLNEISCSASDVVLLPDARDVSTGEDFVIKNTGANTLTVQDYNGNTVATITSGVSIYFWLRDNSTSSGSWGQSTLGAGTSTANAASLVGYGLKAISTTLNTAVLSYASASGFTIDTTYRGKLVLNTGGAVTMTVPDAVATGNDFYFSYRNAGSGTVTFATTGGQLIDGQSSKTFQPGESAMIVCSGSAWYTVGYGRSTDYQFGQLVLDVSAAGTFTLNTAQASNKILSFTGNPASAVTVVVPNTVAVYYIQSNISTAQNITIKTASVAGTAVAQSQRVVVICDGNSVSAAQSPSVATSIAIADGSAASPALFFNTQTNTGFYKYGAQGMGLTVNGTSQMQVDATGVNFPTGLTVGGAAVPTAASVATLTNKTISGASNTLTNIPWSALTGIAALLTANNLSELTATAATARGNLAIPATLAAQTDVAFTTAGTGTNFTLTPTPALSAYAANVRYRVKFHAGGTATPDLNISGLGAKLLKQYDMVTGAKVPAIIKGSQLSDVEYDGTDMVVLDPVGQVSLTDDTTTNATHYMMLSAATSGVAYKVSSTKFTCNPSTGDFTAAGNLTAYSDIRLKSALQPITSALDKVGELSGYTFMRAGEKRRSTGLIAQEVRKVLPEAVLEDPHTSMLSVAYGNMVGLLVEAIKELRQEIEMLKGQK